jgi:hypothetical protein
MMALEGSQIFQPATPKVCTTGHSGNRFVDYQRVTLRHNMKIGL